jgi:hypothetical protein
MLYWMIFCCKTTKYCLYECSESALCVSRSMVFRYLQSSSSLYRMLKCNDGLRHRTTLDVAATACSVKLS